MLLLFVGARLPVTPVQPGGGLPPRYEDIVPPRREPPRPARRREDEEDEEIAIITYSLMKRFAFGMQEETQATIRATISVPDYMSRNAARGLKLYEEGHGGDGLVEATIRDAREMARGSVSEPKLRRIGPWIARHIVDFDAPKNRDPKAQGYPGPGLVAHLLWGSGPDRDGAMRTLEWARSQVAKLDKAKG